MVNGLMPQLMPKSVSFVMKDITFSNTLFGLKMWCPRGGF